MIQFNLLPDIKMSYIKASRQRQLVTVVSFLATAAAVTALVLFFSYVQIAQKKHISDLNGDIKKYSNQLNNVPDLAKVLTIQNQLSSLPALLDQRPITSRLFGYVSQMTPTKVGIGKLDVDFTASTLNVSGSADSLETVNKYVDTFKFTTYTVSGSNDAKPAFSKVVLTNFGRDDQTSTYELNMSFDPAIFDGKQAVALVVPKTVTTRSQTEQPTALFTGVTGTTTGGTH